MLATLLLALVLESLQLLAEILELAAELSDPGGLALKAREQDRCGYGSESSEGPAEQHSNSGSLEEALDGFVDALGLLVRRHVPRVSIQARRLVGRSSCQRSAYGGERSGRRDPKPGACPWSADTAASTGAGSESERESSRRPEARAVPTRKVCRASMFEKSTPRVRKASPCFGSLNSTAASSKGNNANRSGIGVLVEPETRRGDQHEPAERARVQARHLGRDHAAHGVPQQIETFQPESLHDVPSV